MPNQVKEKVEAFLKIATEGLSRADFTKAFKTLTAFVQRVKDSLEVRFIVLEEKLDTKVSKLKDGYTPIKGKDYFDGKDGAIGLTGAMGATGEQGESITGLNGADGSPDTPRLIRDKLEFLKDEDKLSIEAVGNLEKRLQDLEERPLGGKGGGGLSYAALDIHLVDNEAVGTGDGVTTDFSINNMPNPTTSLHIHVGTVELFDTDDFTLSEQTITFLTAPPTGAKIRANYRI